MPREQHVPASQGKSPVHSIRTGGVVAKILRFQDSADSVFKIRIRICL